MQFKKVQKTVEKSNEVEKCCKYCHYYDKGRCNHLTKQVSFDVSDGCYDCDFFNSFDFVYIENPEEFCCKDWC